MKTIIATVIGVALAAMPSMAARRRAVAPMIDSLSIAFVEAGSGDASIAATGSDAWLDLATISHRAGSEVRTTKIRSRFGKRIDRSGAASFGTATISAHLESWDGRATYRLDGQPLSAAAVVIAQRATIGAVTWHTLEIEVPASATEGPLATTIRWEVRSE